MSNRKSLSKKSRFEVFKRDHFTCQYCGTKAPDAVLQVDHIKPVAEGGDNHIMNLVTSCAACNAGKGARELDDNAVLEKQMAQLEELNDRRLQIEMLMEWRNELLSLDNLKSEKIINIINGKSERWSLNEHGVEAVEALVKKYPFDELLAAVDGSFRVYFRDSSESWVTAFNKIAGVVQVTRASAEKPYLRQLFYIRGILRKRVYVNERAVMGLLEDAHLSGLSLDDLKRQASSCRNWTQFRDYCTEATEEVD